MNPSILSSIELDTNKFWLNCTNPANDDSLFIQHSITEVATVYSFLKTNAVLSTMSQAFFKSCYFLKDEYIIACMNGMLLTNRRLFIWFNDLKLTIPLVNLIKYEPAKWDSGIKGEYLYNGATQTFRLGNVWLLPALVNNALNRHKNDSITEDESIILGSFKPALQSKYGISDDCFNSWVPPLTEQPIIQQQFVPAPKPLKNNASLITLFIFIVFIGSCVYIIQKGSNDTGSTSSNSTSVTSNAHRKKCPWCGGIGRVGYAGDSKAQVERTRMGLGNYCTTCGGSGYVDDDK